jgi:biotin synthesis protein BioG
MKTYIRRREKNDRLIIVYGGWGSDENVFIPFCDEDSDLILFYDYSADEPLVLPEAKTYKSIILIGWSLGVWAAEYHATRMGITPDISIAVNGTPYPADDNYGIPLNVFEGTLNNISERNMLKFYLRMFGNKQIYLANRDRIPQRSIKSLHDELRWLYNRIMEQKDPGFRWDYAVICEYDRVFPAKNQKEYWRQAHDTKHITLPLNHYIFHYWNSYIDFVSFVKARKKGNKRKMARI